ncbi:hypothetical protein BV20DRAFT_724205 [Pilatotrama ljubarskyi]|nr:hypothetical protein BV20DRAFT_724205 [Pilatotrama ljubarskyi]
MSSDSDAISHFTPLDELIQVIYQGSARFVIISSVDDTSWTVHVGLTGDEGRWWQGRWTEKDVRAVIGSKVSGFLLDSFVEKMAETLVKGEISIRGWSTTESAPIQLVFGSQAKTPISVPLTELSPQEAAAYATKVFVEIALQAQSRKCRLYPSPLDISTAVPAVTTASSSKAHSRPSPEPPLTTAVKHRSPHKSKGKEKARAAESAAVSKSERKAKAADEEIQALKAELERAKRQQGAAKTDSSKLLSINKPAAAATKRKGVSLANPTQKARKYKPLEFESDEE